MTPRAASQQPQPRLSWPTISNGRLRAWGRVTIGTRSVVRVQVEYVVAGSTSTLEFKTRIANGRWLLNERLSQTVRVP